MEWRESNDNNLNLKYRRVEWKWDIRKEKLEVSSGECWRVWDTGESGKCISLLPLYKNTDLVLHDSIDFILCNDDEFYL